MLRHGASIRVEGGTTHPAQLRLIFDLFHRYCRPIVYPQSSEFGYTWRIVCIVDASFAFLMARVNELEPHKIKGTELFFSALSAFFDAEGAICLRESGRRAYPVLVLSNRNRRILRSFERGLIRRGYHARLYGLTTKDGKKQWQFEVVGNHAIKLLKHLNFRHWEKVKAKEMVQTHTGKPWNEVGPLYRRFREDIDEERDKCVEAARKAYALRFRRKNQKAERLRAKIVEAGNLRDSGQDVEFISKSLNRSVRTVYRWLQKGKKGREIL